MLVAKRIKVTKSRWMRLERTVVRTGEMRMRIWSGNLKERVLLKSVSVDGKIKKEMLKK